MRKNFLKFIFFIFFLMSCASLYAAEGSVLWSFDTKGVIASHPIEGNAVLGSDGTIFITSENKIFAINPDGTKKWEHSSEDWVYSSIAIGINGKLFLGMNNKLCAFNAATGDKVWETVIGGEYDHVMTTPAIGNDGTVYTGSNNGSFYAINNETGEIIWEFNAKASIDFVSPVIGSDGTVYFGTFEKKIFALYDNGTKKWEFNLSDISPNPTYSPFAMGSDGTIYTGINSDLYAINPNNGSIIWHKQLEYSLVSHITPIVGCNDIIYVGGSGNLYAVNKNGSKIWTFDAKDEGTGAYISTSPTLGNDGTIYFGVYYGANMHKLFAVDINNQSVKWTILFTDQSDVIKTSPAISSDGKLYIGIDQKLYAIETSSTGLANCPWPRWRKDNQNRGNANFLINNNVSLYNTLPDTGLNQCYNETEAVSCPVQGEDFFGQDGNFKTLSPTFVSMEINGDKIVKDANSNLMWMQATGDTNTDGNITEADRTSWNGAKDFCENLDYAGYSDWRLPELFELSLIANYGKSNPIIDTSFFQCFSSTYWSSTANANFEDHYWYMDFYTGNTYWGAESDDFYVRCVRISSTDSDNVTESECKASKGYWYNNKCNDKPRYMDNKDGTVTDFATGLIWQKETADINNDSTINNNDAIPWKDALNYCENLNFAGFTDWHLPDIKQLFSLVDFNHTDPSIEQDLFKAENLLYWSSTTRVDSVSRAWDIQFDSGETNIKSKKNYARFVRCVRYEAVPSISCDKEHLNYCFTETECLNAEGYWYNGSCNISQQETCSGKNLQYCTDNSSCDSAGGYWYDNKCNAKKQEFPAVISLVTGWNLKALPILPEKEVSVNIFSSDNVTSVWKWKENNWLIWSPDSNIAKILAEYGLSVFEKVEAGEGFWVNTGGTAAINVGNGDEYGLEKVVVNEGWKLAGVGKKTDSAELSKLEAIKTVWKWSGSSWQIWSPDSNIKKLIDSYGLSSIDAIEKGEGFWINK